MALEVIVKTARTCGRGVDGATSQILPSIHGLMNELTLLNHELKNHIVFWRNWKKLVNWDRMKF